MTVTIGLFVRTLMITNNHNFLFFFNIYLLGCTGACGILVPEPEIKPASPALQGGFCHRTMRKSQLSFNLGFIFTIFIFATFFRFSYF